MAGDVERVKGEQFNGLANEISDAIAAAIGDGMEIDAAVCIAVLDCLRG